MVGYAGVTIAANSDAILSATESPINKIEPTEGEAGSAAATGNAAYHGEFKSKSLRNCHPVRVTEPAVPVMTTDVVYPFQSPPSPS